MGKRTFLRQQALRTHWCWQTDKNKEMNTNVGKIRDIKLRWYSSKRQRQTRLFKHLIGPMGLEKKRFQAEQTMTGNHRGTFLSILFTRQTKTRLKNSGNTSMCIKDDKNPCSLSTKWNSRRGASNVARWTKEWDIRFSLCYMCSHSQ